MPQPPSEWETLPAEDEWETMPDAANDASNVNPWMVGLGAVAAGAGALALRNPAVASMAGKAFDTLNNVRRQSMLSGLALPKSLLGALGGSAMASIERQSVAPLKEMLRLPTNIRNTVKAFNASAPYEGQVASKWAIPGRLLGATDDAAQQAFQRAGFTAEESAREMLQAPNAAADALGLNSRLGQYLVPFRRTPFNQVKEGFDSMRDWSTTGKKLANATSLGSGVLAGEEIEDPKNLAFGTAAMGRRGVPFAVGAAAGRLWRGDSKRSAADALRGISPVNDYSIQEGVLGPLADPSTVLPKPALWKLLFPEDY